MSATFPVQTKQRARHDYQVRGCNVFKSQKSHAPRFWLNSRPKHAELKFTLRTTLIVGYRL